MLGGDFIKRKLVCIVLFAILVFSNIFSVYASEDYFENPGILRNTFKGTPLAPISDGDFSTYIVLDEPIVYEFPTTLLKRIHNKVSFQQKSPELRFYKDNVLVYAVALSETRNIPYYSGSVDTVDGKYCNKIVISKREEGSKIYEVDILDYAPYPKLTNFMPTNGAKNVSIYENVTCNFNMSVKSLNATLKDSNNNDVAFNISGLNTSSVKINPVALLQYSQTYTLTLNNVTGLEGHKNSNTYTMSFSTMSDNEPVKLINVIPPNGSKDIDPNISQCILEFNKPNLQIGTINENNIFLSDSNNNIIPSALGSSVLDGRFIVNMSIPNLDYETDYFINVRGVLDTNDNPLETTYKMRFKTTNDPNLFKIISYRPVNNSVVSLNRKIEIVFSQPIVMDNLSYILKDKDGNSISSVPQIMGSALYITATLEYGNNYNFELEKVQSTTGQILDNSISINFRTMNNTQNNFLNSLLGMMMDLYETVKYYGLIIVGSAIVIGVIFVVSLWLWKKLKKWLIKS